MCMHEFACVYVCVWSSVFLCSVSVGSGGVAHAGTWRWRRCGRVHAHVWVGGTARAHAQEFQKKKAALLSGVLAEPARTDGGHGSSLFGDAPAGRPAPTGGLFEDAPAVAGGGGAAGGGGTGGGLWASSSGGGDMFSARVTAPAVPAASLFGGKESGGVDLEAMRAQARAGGSGARGSFSGGGGAAPPAAAGGCSLFGDDYADDGLFLRPPAARAAAGAAAAAASPAVAASARSGSSAPKHGGLVAGSDDDDDDAGAGGADGGAGAMELQAASRESLPPRGAPVQEMTLEEDMTEVEL
jgi:hypothetical protein